MDVIGLDHVQVAMPAGGEARARAFYGQILGLQEIPKPAELTSRGGVWFRCGSAQLHLGVETDFRPAEKAHPALAIRGYTALLDALRQAGQEVTQDRSVPAVTRCFTFDPFGNRIELVSVNPAV